MRRHHDAGREAELAKSYAEQSRKFRDKLRAEFEAGAAGADPMEPLNRVGLPFGFKFVDEDDVQDFEPLEDEPAGPTHLGEITHTPVRNPHQHVNELQEAPIIDAEIVD